MKSLNDVISGVDELLGSARRGDFEELLSKTKDYAALASKKSAERLEISKRKIDLLDAKTKLSKAYEKYGKLRYEEALGEAVSEEALSLTLEEIRLQKSRAELLEREIETLKEIFRSSEETQE